MKLTSQKSHSVLLRKIFSALISICIVLSSTPQVGQAMTVSGDRFVSAIVVSAIPLVLSIEQPERISSEVVADSVDRRGASPAQAEQVITSTQPSGMEAVIQSVQTITVPGLSLRAPDGWVGLPRDPKLHEMILDYDEVSWVSPDGQYTLTVIANWHLTAPEQRYGSYVMPPRKGYGENVQALPGGVLAQVMTRNDKPLASVDLLVNAAFRLDQASYSVQLSGAGGNKDGEKILASLLTSAKFDPASVPASSLPMVLAKMKTGDIKVASEYSRDSANATMSVNAVSYDRSAASDYALLYDSLFDNSDGCYFWYDGSVLRCYYTSGSYGVDGAHFVNRTVSAGGLPIPGGTAQESKNVEPLRDWLLANGAVSTVIENIKPGDAIFFGRDYTCWGWVGAVTSVDGGGPLLSLHSSVTWDANSVPTTSYLAGVRYTAINKSACSPSIVNAHDFVHIDAIQDAPVAPQLHSNIAGNPSSPAVNQNTTVSFQVCGDSINPSAPQWSTNDLYAQAVQGSTTIDFPHVGTSLSTGGCYAYAQSASLPAGGWWTIHAGYDNGNGFTSLGGVSGVSDNYLMWVVSGAEMQLQGEMTLGASEVYSGSSTSIQFVVKNIAGVDLSDHFRVSLYDANGAFITQFADSGNTTLAANGGEYAYNQSQTFNTPGLYRVVGEHFYNGAWTPIYGNSTKSIIVRYPKPAPPQLAKGMPSYISFAGEPVNTATGSFYHKHTDLLLPTTGLPLEVTRYYNHQDAGVNPGQFGYGWSWLVDMRIAFRSDKTALVTYPDGKLAYFAGSINLADIFDLSGVYVGREDEVEQVTLNADHTSQLVTRDQIRFVFDASGKLAQVGDAQGNQIDITWAGNAVSAMTHNAGWTLSFTYSSGRITRIASSTGHTLNYQYDASGNLTRATDAAGRPIVYAYDGLHRVISIRDASNRQILFNEYDAQNRVLAQTDVKGARVTFSYPAPVAIQRADGSQAVSAETQAVYADELNTPITYTYNAQLQVTSIKDARGALTAFEYDASFNRTRKTDALGNVWRWEYDGRGRVTRETDPLGATWVYTYDAQGNRTAEQNPLGDVRQFGYDATSNVILEATPEDGMITRTFDARGRRLSESNNGAVTQWQYDTPLGLPTVMTDALGGVSRMAYDALGNRTYYQDALGRETRTTYDLAGFATSSTDAQGRVVALAHDANGNLMLETDGIGNTRSYGYDTNDQQIQRVEFDGTSWRRGYDALKRLVSETNPLGGTSSYVYDKAGNLTGKTDARGGVMSYGYDLLGRVISTTDAAGGVAQYGYDAAGRRTSVTRPCDSCAGGWATETTTYDAVGRVTGKTDYRGNTTTFAYDRDGRLVSETDPLGQVKRYAYDARNNIVAVTDRLGNVSRSGYDLANRLISETDRLGNVSSVVYDLAGRKTSQIDPRGYTTRFGYDAADRLTVITDALGGLTRYSYDLKGNRLSETDAEGRVTRSAYDAMGRVISQTNPRGVSEQHGYDAVGNMVALTQANTLLLTRVYNAAGDLLSENNRGAIRAVSYDRAGRVLTETNWQGATTGYAYNTRGQLVTMTDALGNQTSRAYDANGNVLTERNPRGAVTSYAYDALNRQTQVTDALGNITRYAYDAEGRRVSVTDARGNTTQMVYDAEGRLTSQTNPLGGTASYTYDAAGNQATVTDPRGNISRAFYDGLGRVTMQMAPDGTATATAYDKVGNRLYVTDPNGATTRYVYDGNNNATQVTDALNGVTRNQYNAFDQLVRVTDTLGSAMVYTHDVRGNVVMQTDRTGNTTLATYDAGNNLISQTDPLGHATSYAYDALGRKTTVIDALNNTLGYTYDAAGNLIQLTDPRGYTTTYAYDLLNRQTQAQDALGYVTGRGYDAVGNVILTTDQISAKTVLTYDALNRQTTQRDPLGNVTALAYDASGNLSLKTLPNGLQTCYAYDALNRLARVIEGQASCETRSNTAPTTEYLYDAAGNPIYRTDPRGNAWRTNYDALRRVVKEIDPLGNTSVYTYNAASWLTAKRNPEGQVVNYAYDAEGRMIRETYPDGRMVTLSYDAAGRRVSMADALGASTWAYDALNRVMATTDALGQTLTRAYDTNSNRTGLTYPNGLSYGAAFNARNQPITLTDMAGAALNLSFDPRGLLVKQTNPNNTYTARSYDAAGRLTSVQSYGIFRPTDLSHQVYVPSTMREMPASWGGDVTLPTTPPSAASAPTWRMQTAFTYTLDGVGNRVSVDEYRAALFIQPNAALALKPVAFTREYGYDLRGQMVSSTVDLPGMTGTTLYAFDLGQNRVSKVGSELAVSRALSQTASLTVSLVSDGNAYDGANRLTQTTGVSGTTTYAYDKNGNRTGEMFTAIDGAIRLRKTSYNEDGRPLVVTDTTYANGAWSAEAVTRYAYDGMGRRLRQTGGAGETRYVWDGDALAGTSVSAGGGVTTNLFMRLGGLTMQMTQITAQGQKRYWAQIDGNASLIALTDEAGKPADMRLYADYGELLAGDAALTGLSYSGQMLDAATGDYAYRWRDYDPQSGVWTTQDLYQGQPNDPMSLHKYSFVRNDPVSRADMLGLFDYKTGAVQYGDTWEMIAAQWGTSVSTLKQLNPWVTTPRVGDYVQLPACNNAQCQFALGIREIRIAGMTGTQCAERIVQRQREYGIWVAEQIAIRRAQEEAQRRLDEWLSQISNHSSQILFNSPASLVALFGSIWKSVLGMSSVGKGGQIAWCQKDSSFCSLDSKLMVSTSQTLSKSNLKSNEMLINSLLYKGQNGFEEYYLELIQRESTRFGIPNYLLAANVSQERFVGWDIMDSLEDGAMNSNSFVRDYLAENQIGAATLGWGQVGIGTVIDNKCIRSAMLSRGLSPSTSRCEIAKDLLIPEKNIQYSAAYIRCLGISLQRDKCMPNTPTGTAENNVPVISTLQKSKQVRGGYVMGGIKMLNSQCDYSNNSYYQNDGKCYGNEPSFVNYMETYQGIFESGINGNEWRIAEERRAEKQREMIRLLQENMVKPFKPSCFPQDNKNYMFFDPNELQSKPCVFY